MKPQKNKIVFVFVLVGVVLFIVVYAVLTFGKDKKAELKPDRIPMPDLEENQKVYGSKMEALDAIEEERETTAPQIYPDHMVDDKGYFNPDYMEYEKQRIIDSVYNSGSLDRHREPLQVLEATPTMEPQSGPTPTKEHIGDNPVTAGERALEHQRFFSSKPIPLGNTAIMVQVDGDQTIREGHRLNLRLGTDCTIMGSTLPKGTRLYGFVKIRPNRVLLEMAQWGAHAMVLKAHDLQDGQEGIYVENHLKGALAEDALDRTIGGVNLPGVPAISGFKRIFQRDNRNIKVAIPNNYTLILKPGP